jgi:hypothetical protein
LPQVETIQSPVGGAALARPKAAKQDRLSTHSLPAFSRSAAAVAQLQHVAAVAAGSDADSGAGEPLATVSMPGGAPAAAQRHSASAAPPRPRPPPRRARSQPGPIMGATIHEGVVAPALASGGISSCTALPGVAAAAASAGRGDVRGAGAAAGRDQEKGDQEKGDQEKEVEAGGDEEDCPGLWYACERLSELRKELKREPQSDEASKQGGGMRRSMSMSDLQ